HYGSGHVSAIRFGQQLVTEFTRDRLHREVRRTQGAREQLRQYDSLGRRTLQRSELSTDVTLPEQALLERLYRYTARGELSGVSDTLRGEVDYGYDAEGRLLKHYEARQGHSRAQFSYDAADNLAASDAAAPVTDNRLQHWQALFMKYDHWGNLVSRRNGLYEQHYAYDAENRLVSARGTGPEGRFEARYHYDALGRRTRKIVTTTHGTTDTRFLWQGYRLLQEQQESGLRSTYVYDPNEAWSPLARVDHLRDQSSGEIYWFNTDLNGAPLEVTDERGAVRWSGQYGSFGEVRHQSEGFSRVVNRTAMAHQPLRYAGQYADGETGLHYNLFRYYDPQVGRFIVQDPIGLNGGWNLYQYAPNPLGWIDPLGLSSCTTKFKSRNAAFRAAKRDAGIPVSQQPSKVELVPLTDRNGKSILGDDHLPIKTREYTFSRPDGESIVIQDHSPGHIYGPPGTPGNQGPHLNVRPISDTRNGTISGTLEHYPF
ncbi:RHS repeat-associated core domain-containing protein, partial [Enterobacter hormaechei]